MVTTTHGPIQESRLLRTLGFEERPTEFVVWVEWRMAGHSPSCPVCQSFPDNPQPDEKGLVLVRRDAHVILKEPTATADLLVHGQTDVDVTVGLTGVQAQGAVGNVGEER
jgi:hypothetical protein